MAEAAKVQEPSMDELRDRIRRVIAEDDKPADHWTESASVKSDTAPRPTQAPGRGQRLDPGSFANPDNQVKATVISDCAAALLNAAAAVASPTPRSASSSPDPTLLSAPISRLDAREGDSALLRGYASNQAPESSPVPESAFSGNEPQESRLDRAGAQVTMSTGLPLAPRDRDESRFGHTGQQLAMSSHGPQSAPALAGEDCQQLISRETNNAVHSAFDALTQTALLHNARTLEDMVREMLRPILKVWLDDNLPGIVEGLVRTELERARRPARGAR